MQFLAADPLTHDQPRTLENAEVFHDSEARHLQFRLELGEREPVLLEESVEKESARRIRERLEDAIVCHGSSIGDLLVTCQDARLISSRNTAAPLAFTAMSNTYVTDHPLASRLERAEGLANVASVEARAIAEPSVGATWIEVEGTLAMFDGPGSPLTQTFGLGMLSPPTANALDEIESFFASRGADIMHETCPIGDPALLR